MRGRIHGSHGFTVIKQTHFLRHLFPEVGFFLKRTHSRRVFRPSYGVKVAKEIARLDIGQTVIVATHDSGYRSCRRHR